jgi:tight adherence protein B
MDTSLIILFGGIWILSMGVWWFVSRMLRNADADRIKKRLLETPDKRSRSRTAKANSSPQLLSTEDLRHGRMVRHLLRRLQLTERIQTLLEQAGSKWTPAKLIQSSQALFLVGFLIVRFGVAPDYLLPQLAGGLAAASLPFLHVVRLRNKRMHKFEEMFPESLEFVARSMRAGHAFSVSIEMIHREFQEPLAGEFRRTFDEHNLGLPLDQALLKLVKRVPSLDVHFFVSAVLLQKRTGGNLAEILEKLAYVIRERFKLRGKIRAISAHGRMTGMALTSIPIGVAVLMFFTNPEYVSFFIEDETGNLMMGVAIGLQALGYLIIRKIVAIEV